MLIEDELQNSGACGDGEGRSGELSEGGSVYSGAMMRVSDRERAEAHWDKIAKWGGDMSGIAIEAQV
jgi:hypothetical protein